jgi:hypothetical protein
MVKFLLRLKNPMRKIISSLLLAVLLLSNTLYGQSRGTPSTLRVRVDANGYLVVAGGAQTSPITSGTFATRVLKTDASGNLLVVLAGGPISTAIQLPASTGCSDLMIQGVSPRTTTGWGITTTPTIVECVANVLVRTVSATLQTFSVPVAVTVNGLTTTSTDGITSQNTTAALIGTQVQISPRVRLSGTAWDTDDAVSRTVSFFTESLPITGNTVSGTWKLGYIDPVSAAITYPMTLSSAGGLTVSAAILGGADVRGGATGDIFWSSRNLMRSAATGLWATLDNVGSFGIQINTGTAAPTVTTCGTGTITANSRNTAGGFTATGATACTVTFGAPNWTNTPFCTITLRNTPTTTPYISAKSASAITISGLTAGDVIDYHCLGPV